MHARCVREDTKQTLKGNLQADGVQSPQTLFVRYCPYKAGKSLTTGQLTFFTNCAMKQEKNC
ncbi:hypothetical protein, partial [uncultured Ruminococcus sp.]|uniref:hypothetical protein n=1 Tax=uncultured Ruminococcus sp. TaxID=165186 RepID=UPI002592AD5B